MALIPCSQCGHQISSLARACPKCGHSNSSITHDVPHTPVEMPAKNVTVEMPVSPAISPVASSSDELHQVVFKPSLDERMILEGPTFLIKSMLNISACYAYLTSKRYALCDSSGANIIFQTAIDGFASITEGRHLISRKIIINTVSGETYQIKSRQHQIWLSALLDPNAFADLYLNTRIEPSHDNAATTEWYYMDDEEKIGPIAENNMIQFIRNNHTIYRDTKVWNAYLTEWKRADESVLSFNFRDVSHYEEGTECGFENTCRHDRSFGYRFRRLFSRFV